ncbi:MAG: tetratricopeptide repeat protein [Sphingobacteriaceae bacterium]|nr:tetratricopeptide repeat protein [Sphingobacteriaceae bacterium]
MIIFLGHQPFSKGQNNKIDSLKKILSAKKDTAFVNCLYLIAKEFGAVSQDSLMLYSNKIIQKSKDINYNKGYAKGLILQAGFYRRKGEVDTATVIYNRIIEISRQYNLPQELGEAEMFIGFILQNQGEYDQSLLHLISAEKEFEKVGNKLLLARNFWMMGNTYLKLKSYDESRKSFAKGKDYFGELNDSLGYFDCVLNISITHIEVKEFDKALELILQSESYYRKVKHTAALAASLVNKSEVLISMGNTLEAEPALKEALEIKKQLGAPIGIATCLLNLGGLYQKKKDYASSEKAYLEAMSFARKDNSLEIILKSYNGLYLLFKEKGDASQALDYHEKYLALNDSMYSSEKNEIIEEMKAKFETEKKDKELIKKDAEITVKRNQQYLLFGGLGLVIVFAGFMYNRFKVTNRQKEIIEKQKLLVEEKQKEILDSIHYAKRIQRSLLPNENFLNKSINRLKSESKKDV